jgi:hypothetical protein
MAKQSIAGLQAQLEQSRIRTLDELHRHEETRKELEALRAEMKARDASACCAVDDDPGITYQEMRTALALQLYPQDKPESVGWGDILSWARQFHRDQDQLTTAARNLAERAGLDCHMNVGEIIDALGEYVTTAEGKVESLPDDWEDWAEFIKETTLAPESIERLCETLALLGLSDYQTRYVLASSDPQSALKAIRS